MGLGSCVDGSENLPLQDEDRSRSRHHLFFGFLYLKSGMPPERFRSKVGVVDSEQNQLAVIRLPKWDFEFY